MEELRTVNTTNITNKELKGHATKIKSYGTKIRENYLKIARELFEIESTECYLDDGFTDTQDFASKVLNIQKTTCYNLIAIGRDFLNEDGTRTALTEKGNDYGVSQLQILLPLGVTKAKELHDDEVISPDMSVRQLKEVIKSETKGETEPEDEDDDIIDTEGEETNEEHVRILADIQILGDGTFLVNGDESDDLNELYDAIKELVDTYFENK